MFHAMRDARFGLRLLWKKPGFTLVAVLALALGIGANTAIFSIVYATLLAPLPYPDSDQLVMVWSKLQGNRNVTSTGAYVDWKAQNAVFQDLNAWTGRAVSLAATERPEQVQATVMTPGFYTMVGNGFQLGRDFLPEEGELGKHHVVILTHRLWRERFGSDAALVGRPIRVDGRPHTVVGILAPGLSDRGEGGLTLPLAFAPDQINYEFSWLLVMGRLKPGVSLQQANANMETVAQNVARAQPRTNTGWSASVEPLKNNFLSRQTTTALWLLLGAVGFVLLIACANVANLLLARGTARQREIAVRASLGAGRRQIFTQFLTESLVLAAIGGGLGVLLASGLLELILALMPANTLPIEADVRLSLPVLLFTLAVSVLSGVVFGCAPAWQATRSNLSGTLKEEGRSALGGGRHRVRRALVAGEFALALTLLAGGGLAIHSLIKLMRVDLGFRTDHVLTFFLPVPQQRLAGAARIEAFYRQLLERIRALPGIESAAVSTGIPLRGTGFGLPFQVVGKPIVDPSQRPGAGFSMVTPDYFHTFGIQMTRGRALTEHDVAGGTPVAVVNESFVKRHLAGLDPLTQRLLVERLVPGLTRLGPPVEWQIVGVYRTVRNGGIRGGPDDEGFPEIDVPFWQCPWPAASVAVRTAGDPASVTRSIAAVVHSLDPDLPVTDVRTMNQIVGESLAGDRFAAALFGGFAGIALVLAALGIYGVMSFAVAQRTHEIGLRMALGADRTRVLREVLKEGMATALVGLGMGSIGAYVVGRAMRGMWYRVGALEPASFGLVAATLLACAVMACLVPARRAASLDPMAALRQE